MKRFALLHKLPPAFRQARLAHCAIAPRIRRDGTFLASSVTSR
jgi:hypothetical protein